MEDVLRELVRRTAEVVAALGSTDLDAPSELPGWSRLTIACHLRFGAAAFRSMTIDAVAGREASYYPLGRAEQRPGTLEPGPGESAADVVASLRDTSAALDRTWAGIEDWSVTVREPADNPDLGDVPLGDLPLFRLTEVEVHGTDLGVGLGPWSDVLVRHALPMRLDRLARRTPQAPGAWRIRDLRLGDGSEPEVLDGSDRDLFALTLGRLHPSESFSQAYPGP